MVVDRREDTVREGRFAGLAGYLRKGDLLVLNDTAVMAARLTGRKKETGGRVEALLLRESRDGLWRALMRGRVSAGTKIDFSQRGIDAVVESVVGDGEVALRFRPPSGARDLMRRRGLPPLPPYIRRDERTSPAQRASDRRRYQTIYAAREGSAAAPTAGLHFTAGVLRDMERRGVKTAYVTLHVGPGTFRPVREERVEEMAVPSERAFVPAATARAVAGARRRGGRVIAVGTTVTRTLEHFRGADGGIGRGWREVDLTIRPGYRFRVVDGMVTNFHLPRSSLLVLVSAFAGRERVLALYRQALQSGYRFYSYGDAMLIL